MPTGQRSTISHNFIYVYVELLRRHLANVWANEQ